MRHKFYMRRLFLLPCDCYFRESKSSVEPPKILSQITFDINSYKIVNKKIDEL